MPRLVLHHAKLTCDQGSTQSLLTVLPDHQTDGDAVPAATVMDKVAGVNIAPFGDCQALGSTCTPEVDDPWTPGAPDVEIRGLRVLTSDSTCACTWTGTIAIVDPASDVDVDPS